MQIDRIYRQLSKRSKSSSNHKDMDQVILGLFLHPKIQPTFMKQVL